MVKIILLITTFIFHNLLILSQINQQWVARYNGPANNHDRSYSVALDDLGNVYVTGTSTVSTSSLNFTTIKYNSSGIQQWISEYNGPGNGNDVAYSIAIDLSGNVYVSGGSLGIGTNYDYATVKYNSLGVQQWIARYNGPGNGDDVTRSLVIDVSGNVYVTGQSSYDYATIKYNSSGIQQWVARYNGPVNGYDEANSIAIDFSGNVYVTGVSSGISTSFDYATIKYNSLGIQQWVTRYNGPGNGDDEAYAIVLDISGDVYITGRSTGNNTNFDYATIKYNSIGIQQWVSRYTYGPGFGSDAAYSIILDPSGNVYVTGGSEAWTNNSDYATIKYNSLGIQQWVSRYNGTGNGPDLSRSMAIDASGNIYVSGYSVGNGTGYDCATIKYNSSGIQEWISIYNGPSGNDYGHAIALDTTGYVYVTGSSYGINTDLDFLTIKYSQLTGIKLTHTEIPNNNYLYQNYPNPFNPSTLIKYDIYNKDYVTLKIYDVLGREVITLVNELQNAGMYSVYWDASAYPSGIYIYKIKCGDYTKTMKMVLLK